MDIKFVVEPSTTDDDYLEVYTAYITTEEGTTVIRATEYDLSYDGFRAEVLENLFESLAEAAGIPLTIETEDYAIDEDEETLQLTYLGDQEDYGDCDCNVNGC